MSSSEIRARLIELAQERFAAEHAGLGGNQAYMTTSRTRSPLTGARSSAPP